MAGIFSTLKCFSNDAQRLVTGIDRYHICLAQFHFFCKAHETFVRRVRSMFPLQILKQSRICRKLFVHCKQNTFHARLLRIVRFQNPLRLLSSINMNQFFWRCYIKYISIIAKWKS